MSSIVKSKHFTTSLLIVFYGIIVLKSAWICDDAYISLRTVDNFVNGFGLRWNIAERVQSFTHPLWLILLSAGYFFSREPFYTTIIFSFIISVLSVSLYLYKIEQTWSAAVLGVVLLCSSKAFIDYSTSGLENPLTFLCAVIYLLIFFSPKESRLKIFWLSLVAALATLNRMDSILLYVPSLLFCFFVTPEKKNNLKYAVVAFLPFIVWEIFSISYYGVFFPNTAYAKLGVDVPALNFIIQGSYYYLNSLTFDPLTLISILSCPVVLYFTRDQKSIYVYLGVFLYLLYILRIGGGFMSGRFFAAPFFVSVIILTYNLRNYNVKILVALSVIVLVTALFNPVNPLYADKTYSNKVINKKGIADERGWYYQGTGILLSEALRNRSGNMAYVWALTGKKFNQTSDKTPVRITVNAGLIGYYSGPNVYLIDQLGLCDPFIARLKPDLNAGWRVGLPSTSGWRIGHFYRHVPKEYFESRWYNKNLISVPGDAALYDQISLITSGDIFSMKRFLEIWKFNFVLKS